jgi:hypothetical protein
VEQGFKVCIVPEAATMLNSGGAKIANAHINNVTILKFQISLIKIQMRMEDIFIEYLEEKYPNEPRFILCDRGAMDGFAYMLPSAWQVLLDETGWTTTSLRDSRYDLVIHLVTAADGAEQYYDTETNKSRYENRQEAMERDKRTQQAWVGHPRFL